MLRRIGWGCLVWWAIGSTGCAGADALSRELSLLRRDVRDLKKDLLKTQRQVERLESRVTLLSLGSNGVERTPATPVAPVRSGPPAARSGAPTGRVLPVVRLGQQAAAPHAAGSNQGYEEGAMDDGSPPVLIKLGPSKDQTERLSVDHGVLKRPDPVLQGASRRGSARAKYKKALATLREAGKPEAALSRFEAFVRAHPRSQYADNAVFWMGECHYSLGRFTRAVQAFKRVISDYPESSKVPHAMLRMAEVHRVRGHNAEARKLLKALVRAHPRSEAAKRARERLKAKGN